MFFRRGLTWRSAPHAGSGGDDQGAVRSGERGAESLDGAPVPLANLHELREVVVEGGVDHAVRLGRPAAQTLQVFQIPSMNLGPAASRIRPSQSEHLMAIVDEFRNNG